MRNIEIKAKIHNAEHIVGKLEEMCDGECVVLEQSDTFFKSMQGRLKLREIKNRPSELIYYNRANVKGPKLCTYEITRLDDKASGSIKRILTDTNGIRGTVRKTRKLYIIGQTRIHVDEVDGLGNFIEFEVVLTDEQDLTSGENIAHDLMASLNVNRDSLISGAYIDLLEEPDECAQ
ncbi:hypothetical protein KM043_003810 [Ampulex compressa]|nr:hypothetical protein KM043_003810 [Ampulex compressa]